MLIHHDSIFNTLKPLLLGAAVSLTLQACARPEIAMTVAYEEKDHAAWMASGTAEISGEGFIRRPNARLARCSGGRVRLAPASPYFREWVRIIRRGGNAANARQLAQAHKNAIRTTQCNMQGRFTFENLPAGKWFVLTQVTYEDEDTSDNSTFITEVETKAGEAAKVILSNPNRV